MRALTRASLRSAPSYPRCSSPCRSIIKHGSSNLSQRAFQTCISWRNVNEGPTDESHTPIPPSGAPTLTEPDNAAVNGNRPPANGPGNGSGSPKQRDPNNYGSASNRARRNRMPKELPPVYIPDWFHERNVTLLEKDFADDFSLTGSSPPRESLSHQIKADMEIKDSVESTVPDSDPKKETSKNGVPSEARAATRDLHTPKDVLEEILRMLRGVMTIPPMQYADMAASIKSHILLYCPKYGASRYLIQLVMQLTRTLGKFDYIRLDAQDIAEIGGGYMDDPGSFEPNSLSSLGYDASLVAAYKQAHVSEQLRQEEDFDEDEDEDVNDKPSTSSPYLRPTAKSSNLRGNVSIGMGIIPMGSLVGNLQEAFKSMGNTNSLGSSSSLPKAYMMNDSQDTKDNTQDLKMGLLVETLLNAPERKSKAKGSIRHTSGPALTDRKPESEADKDFHVENSAPLRPESKNLIIFIEDYPQINTTINGGKFLDKLHEVVDAKRSEGQKILIVGTASTKEMMPSFSKSGVNEVQAEPINGPMRTIVVPVAETSSAQVLVHEHKNKIKAMNIRHLRDMIRRLAPAPGQVGPIVDDWNLEIDSKVAFLADLDESVWPIDRINRVATFSLGSRSPSGLEVHQVEKAIAGIYATDRAKYAWVRKEKADEKKAAVKPERRERDVEERIRKLRTKCNSHEKKLLNGVIDADSIRTTFADVRAPPETIEALKTLTSLSLLRPDAFTYGVLATDRIPGLLLYGPPGTGKTLLAKAVAKESGATVLEVSGSDVYDMYVGEGEKNVRAIFSLAKKLAPCIVFIDEADAILGSRSGASNRTSHRELINQFLREWDGMTDLNAFIMVATNRPFDLDEASLRRLPRRLLVDLPVEKDREEILKIHLKDEILDPEIALSKLAAETPFYSGSDLKNLCVAAALACVREEFDTAAEHNKNITNDTSDSEKYKYAEKRTLHERHFAKGMDEISASISEDMGSLSAIRKFDEKYGDRRGRRKKLGGYGFKTVEDGEGKGSDAVRVRNQ